VDVESLVSAHDGVAAEMVDQGILEVILEVGIVIGCRDDTDALDG
jgi:hypothetical protein